ncbi:MAG: Lrp/AsnC family transcriptional regulator [Candidatus Diapherotrites archaeon]
MAKNLDSREEEVLIELLKNAKISDKELAKKLGTSQPTITRIRNKLQQKHFFSSYTVLPSLSNLGLNLMVFTFLGIVNFKDREKILKWIREDPRVMFASEGEGLRQQNICIISLHPSFEHYEDFLTGMRNALGNGIGNISNFLIANRNTIKDFDLDQPIENFLHITLKKMRAARDKES